LGKGGVEARGDLREGLAGCYRVVGGVACGADGVGLGVATVAPEEAKLAEPVSVAWAADWLTTMP